MIRHPTLSKVALLVPLLFVLLPACSSGDPAAIPLVTVSGQPVVMLGTSAALAAKTTNGNDPAYVWMSSNPVVAQVDGTGMVTGMATGQAVITATGATTGASGSFTVVVSADPSQGVPFRDDWASSAHADGTAEAFTHWDDDGAVPTSCARCHSTHGFRDYLGDDGSAFGVVDQPAALGTTVECSACHNEQTEKLDSVTFPSGVVVPNSLAEEPLGREAVCMTCHQGRSSTQDVDDDIAAAAPATDDTIIPGQRFINIHYFPAGATRYGGTVRGGYLYDGVDVDGDGRNQTYDVLFRHVPDLDACQDCHDPHTLEVRMDVCTTCHNVTVPADLRDIRMLSSATRDYDGDGNLIEGIWFEIQGLRAKLLQAMQDYANDVIGTPLVYDEHTYPYFFNDTPPPTEWWTRARRSSPTSTPATRPACSRRPTTTSTPPRTPAGSRTTPSS